MRPQLRSTMGSLASHVPSDIRSRIPTKRRAAWSTTENVKCAADLIGLVGGVAYVAVLLLMIAAGRDIVLLAIHGAPADAKPAQNATFLDGNYSSGGSQPLAAVAVSSGAGTSCC